jgi:hypothetical protein
MGPVGECRTCHAPILWLAHAVTQRLAPIDLAEDPAGNVVIDVDAGTYRVLAKAEEYQGPRRTNHWQTCPTPPVKVNAAGLCGLVDSL